MKKIVKQIVKPELSLMSISLKAVHMGSQGQGIQKEK